MRTMLRSIALRGFKTFVDLPEFELRPINVLIGPNGAGKSNFISFFRLLSWAMTPPGKLREYVGRQGGASNLLSDGPTNTREIVAHLRLETEAGNNEYAFRLAHAADDTLIFTEEKFRFWRKHTASEPPWVLTDVGHREAQLVTEANSGNSKTAEVIHNLLRRIVVYQFHNTSETARIRNKWDVEDNRYMKEDGANLASVLYRLKNNERSHYESIVQTLQLILPFFDDFELEPEYGTLLLRWREKHSDRVFNASQAADGMLRAMALVTLLSLPDENLPNVMILDEPELGLHPKAISIVGSLARILSKRVQIILATQSPSLVNCFDLEDIVVVERAYESIEAPCVGRYSSFKRLDPDKLQEWLDEYTLSELWDKNLLGGRP